MLRWSVSDRPTLGYSLVSKVMLLQMASPSEAEGVGWSSLVDVFRTCPERRLLILQMGEAHKYMHIPGIVERVTERFKTLSMGIDSAYFELYG